MTSHKMSSRPLLILKRFLAQNIDKKLYITPPVRKNELVPVPLYGGRRIVTMLPGSGIGLELMNHVRDIFRVAGVPVDFEIIHTDGTNDEANLDDAITSIRRNSVAIKGNIEQTSANYVHSRNVIIRNELDLYVSIIHCKSYPNVRSKYRNVDIVVVRQNTEGEYSMLEHEVVHGVVESMKIITKSNSHRVARYAFEYAKKFDRKKVTVIHKANIMKLSDGLFLASAEAVAKDYPEIKFNHMIVDNCCMQLLTRPDIFDVMLMPNLYGTIISNILCGMLGGAGLLAGGNYNDYYGVFEMATRSTGSNIMGKNIANPIAMVNASIDLLDYLGYEENASIIRKAIEKTICVDRIHTADLGGTYHTTDVVQRIIDNILLVAKTKF